MRDFDFSGISTLSNNRLISIRNMMFFQQSSDVLSDEGRRYYSAIKAEIRRRSDAIIGPAD